MVTTRIQKFGQFLQPVIRFMSTRPGDLFQSSKIANVYAKYRPTYGPQVSEAIINFCKENESCKFSIALDVGCGSGQSTLLLINHFQKVIGMDISEAQISRAPADIPNLKFFTGSAEELWCVDSGSVDLVTVATALHWLDLDKFYPEVERVLSPGGALVAYTYTLAHPDEPLAMEVVDDFLATMEPYWAKEMQHIFTQYRNIPPLFSEWRRNDSLTTEKCCRVDDLVGFLASWSAYHRYLKDYPTSRILTDVKARLQAVYEDGNGKDRDVMITWPVFMLMGRKPRT